MRRLRRALLMFAHTLADPGYRLSGGSCQCGPKWFAGCPVHSTKYAFQIDKDGGL